jgi:hypothetical protein
MVVAIGFLGFYLYGLASMGNINPPDERPFYVTQQPLKVKHILLPAGSKITYEKKFFWQKREQSNLLSEQRIAQISFPKDKTLDWGDVPITSIVKFYNSSMRGYTVYADFDRLSPQNETDFAKLWQSCNDALGVTVRNTDDWSFDQGNIVDVNSCGVNFQRYFTEDGEQQAFLDELLAALKTMGG